MENVTVIEPVILGGLSKTTPADEEIQKLVDSLSNEIKLKAGNKNYPHLKAVSYKSQTVSGRNYFIKVDAGHEHIHLRVYVPLPVHGKKAELTSIQTNKKLEDSIEFM